MANGHVEIHDLFSGQNGITSSTESKKYTSCLESSEDMVEFRILMAYAQRRRPKDASQENSSTPHNNNPSTQTEGAKAEKKKKKKKKKIFKKLPKVLTCLKPQTKEEIPSPCDGEKDTSIPSFRSGKILINFPGWLQKEDFEDCKIAIRLAEISDEIPFVPPDIESDAPEDEVEKVIGLILRDAGDRLYEKELKDKNIVDLLGNYSFFENVILSLLKRMGLSTNTESLGPKVSPKTQIAVACE
ncbi:hypothetical protein NL108_000649, partial [Boleophthalmus pectinirostris]